MLELAGTGDDGTTGLLGGGRAAKDDPRIEAFGTIDEASSALGLELGTNPSAGKKFVVTAAADVERLEKLMAEIEAEAPMPEGFILPGATPASAALDLARSITRRAERRCVSLRRSGGLPNPEVGRWLNRLSLLLFVLGRYEESLAGRPAKPARSSHPGRSN